MHSYRKEAVLARRPGDPATGRPTGLRSVIMEVMAMVDDPVMSVAQLGKVIASHEELSERVLRNANSPINALPGRVHSIASAITLLGFNSLRDTVIRVLVHGAMRSMVYTLVHYDEFWHHSISCGTAARILAGRFCPDRRDGAFLAGLFHDTGILLLAQGEAGDLARLARLTEGATAGTPPRHEAVGAWLATQWHLGADVAEAIACHHFPGEATIAPRLAATVHVADVLTARLHLGELPHDGGGEFAPEALEILRVDAKELSLENLAKEARLIRTDLAAAPDFQAMADSLKNALVDGIGALPERQRLTFALHYLEGLTLVDIARVLRVSDADVQNLHAAAIDVLSGIIQDRI